jgi:hypothetical protein
MAGENGDIMVLEVGSHDERIMLNEYKGIISLIICREGADGKNYFRMAFPKTKSGPSNTAIPLGVRLGARKQAIGIMKQFIKALEA